MGEYHEGGWKIFTQQTTGGWCAYTNESPYVCVHGETEAEALHKFRLARNFYIAAHQIIGTA